MITEIEQETSDIEWFFTDGQNVGFVASGGGKLPSSVSSKSVEEIELLADYFRCLPMVTEVSISSSAKASNNNAEYLSCFAEMASKGLFSFDKSVLSNFSDTNYRLIAKPLNPLKFNELPLEIANLITDTKINGGIGEQLQVSPDLQSHPVCKQG